MEKYRCVSSGNATIASDNRIQSTDSRLVHDETLDREEEGKKELDDDELFEELENDDYGMSSFREQRIEEFKEE